MGSEGRPPTKQRLSEELLLRPPTKAGVWTERGAAAWWALNEERHRSALEAEERKALQMNLSEALSKALGEAQQRGVRVLWHGSVQPVAESPQNGSKERHLRRDLGRRLIEPARMVEPAGSTAGCIPGRRK